MARGLTTDQIQQIKAFFVEVISTVCKTCKLRQRVAATAAVYLRRFYLRSPLHRHDPWLIAPACLFLACKAEETWVASRHLEVCMRRVRPEWPYNVASLLDAEMLVLDALDHNLVVYHPYTPLLHFFRSPAGAGVPPLAAAHPELAQRSWAAINDSYTTDVLLLHPPHIVALGCVQLAAATLHADVSGWMAALDGGGVDHSRVFAAAQLLLRAYELRDQAPTSADECMRLLMLLEGSTKKANENWAQNPQ